MSQVIFIPFEHFGWIIGGILNIFRFLVFFCSFRYFIVCFCINSFRAFVIYVFIFFKGVVFTLVLAFQRFLIFLNCFLPDFRIFLCFFQSFLCFFVFFLSHFFVQLTIFGSLNNLCTTHLYTLIFICIFFELLHILWVITFVIHFLQFSARFFLADFSICEICYFYNILIFGFFTAIIKIFIFFSQFRIIFSRFLYLGFAVIIIFLSIFQGLCVYFISVAILNFIQKAIIKIFGSFFCLGQLFAIIFYLWGFVDLFTSIAFQIGAHVFSSVKINADTVWFAKSSSRVCVELSHQYLACLGSVFFLRKFFSADRFTGSRNSPLLTPISDGFNLFRTRLRERNNIIKCCKHIFLI